MNENDKVICEADIGCYYWSGAKKVLMIIYYVIVGFNFYRFGPAISRFGKYSKSLYLWGMRVYSYGLSRFSNSRDIDSFLSTLADDETSEVHIMALIIGIAITLILFFAPIFIFSKIKNLVNQSTLRLKTTGLSGEKRLLNSRYTIDIPIENITSISYKKSIIGMLTSSSSILIASSKGNDVFHAVRNADSFIDAVQKEINKKKGIQEQPTKIEEKDSAEDKIKSLKKMLDDGLISQEDFETKKKDILSKM